MKIFWDTSAVLSLVLRDKHGTAASNQAARANVIHVTTPFVALEAESRLRALEWESKVKPADGALALVAIERVFASRLISVRNVKESRLVAAEGQRMIRHFSTARPHKTMDLIHVSCARLLQAEGFFSFDSNQSALAEAAGFSVKLI